MALNDSPEFIRANYDPRVVSATTPIEMKTVIIETRGGVIQDIYSDSPETRIVTINWDEADEPTGRLAQDWQCVRDIGSMSAEMREQLRRSD